MDERADTIRFVRSVVSLRRRPRWKRVARSPQTFLSFYATMRHRVAPRRDRLLLALRATHLALFR